MLGRLWPRFALEACFLIGVAVVAGLLHLTTLAIVAVMLIAYLATVAVEWTASRAARPKAEARLAAEPETVVEPALEPALEPEPALAGGIVGVDTTDPLAVERWVVAVAAEPESKTEPEPEP